MKIGILTFHFAHNYGAMLQAYALKTYLTEKGYNAEIINYIPKHMRIKYFYLNWLELIILRKRSVIKAYIKQWKNKNKFDYFQQEYMQINNRKILSKPQLKQIRNDYDYIIIGSDQVWNIHITNNDMSYFADFLDSPKAISYAASCGDALGTVEFSTAISNYIDNFKAISVREKSSKEYFDKLFKMSIDCVVDPVFLLETDAWRNLIYKSKRIIKKKYIFYYTIEKNIDLSDECNIYAKENNLIVFSAHGEMKKMINNVKTLSSIGPIEFLNLIYYADCIFTNSFHATAFSIIFNKKVYLRLHSKTGNRITDLLQYCGINWNGDGTIELDEKNNYDLLKIYINESKNFLERSL